MAYRFSNYKDLAAVYRLGTDYFIRHRSGIEKPASLIADEITGLDYPYYAFEANLSNGNLFELHILQRSMTSSRHWS